MSEKIYGQFDIESQGIIRVKQAPKKTINRLKTINRKGDEAAPINLKAAVLPSDEKEQNKFVAMLNGTATNQLVNISTRTQMAVNEITGKATIKQGDLTVFIDRCQNLPAGMRTSTYKLLDACIIELSAQNNYRGDESKINPHIVLPLERLMEWCGIDITKASKDKFRRRAKEDLEILYRLSLEWEESCKQKKNKDCFSMRLCEAKGIKNGNILFSFTSNMAQYLNNAYVMQYPMELLKVDARNPNAYHVGRKLAQHHSIDRNQSRGTAGIISVTKLLEVCPDIPTYEQVLATDRALDRRIIKPLESALDAVSFIKWELSNAKGEPLKKSQLKNMDYNTYKTLYIKFAIEDAPDRIKMIEAKKTKYTPSKKKKEETA